MSTSNSPAVKNTVESRWWYWIALYVVSAIVVIPLVITISLLIAIAVLIGIGSGSVPGIVWVFSIAIFMIVLSALAFGVLVVFLLLPIALYFDARAIGTTSTAWDPDPVIYAVLAALQFIVTPIAGLIVAVYYLYRRHVEIGIP